MQTNNLFVGVPPNAKSTDVGLLIVRVFVGLALALAHGWGKVPPSSFFVSMVEGMGMPAPAVFAWLAATAEFGGGLFLALGLLTRPAALLVVGHFAIVVSLAHAGDPFGDRELAMMFGAFAVLFLLAGAGRYSLDGLLSRRGRSTQAVPPEPELIAAPTSQPRHWRGASREIRVQRRPRSPGRARS